MATVTFSNLNIFRGVVFMALGATQVFLVCSPGAGKSSGNLVVTIGTISAVDICSKSGWHRYMMAMTGATVGSNHLLIMTFVTLRTVGLILVLHVTFITTHLRMRSVRLSQLGCRFSVTGGTEFRGQAFCFKWRQRIVCVMTTEARLGDRAIGMPLMTVETIRH